MVVGTSKTIYKHYDYFFIQFKRSMVTFEKTHLHFYEKISTVSSLAGNKLLNAERWAQSKYKQQYNLVLFLRNYSLSQNYTLSRHQHWQQSFLLPACTDLALNNSDNYRSFQTAKTIAATNLRNVYVTLVHCLSTALHLIFVEG